MTHHRPQHLLIGIVSLPLIASHPLYHQYNLSPRNELPLNSDSSIHHRILETKDFHFDFDISADSACTSPLIDWSMSKVKEMGYDTYKELYDNKILEMPYIYKHYIDKNEDQESFGADGAETEELVQRHRDTMAFWTEADVDDTVKTDGILLLSMHGRDLMDNDKLVPTIIHMFDFENENDVLEFARKVQEYVEALPDGYDNPLLTMNAVATRGGEGSRSSSTVASLIIGDGVLQFVSDSDLFSSGPDFVHAHEFGHHLQYEMDMAHNVPPGYENDIRRKELMADAISAYFLAHDRGGNMDAHAIGEFSMTAFAMGDCNVGQEDHHGTPKQRYCASVWGASRAALAPDGSPLIDPETFVELFNAAYDGIFELDDAECTLILEEPDEDVDHATASLPASVEEAFSPEEDYETTDGSSASGGSGVYDITIEPPHETTYINGSTASKEQVVENPPTSTSAVEQATNTEDNEAYVIVEGHPSTTNIHELSGEDRKYACNLPWVYCNGGLSSSGRKWGYSISLSVAALIFSLSI